MPLALLTNWYANRSLSGLYANSTACYGRIVALRDIPAFRDQVEGFTIHELVQGYRGMAFTAAADLEMDPDAVTRELAEKERYFAARYAALRGQENWKEMLGQIDMAQRCLLPPGALPKA